MKKIFTFLLMFIAVIVMQVLVMGQSNINSRIERKNSFSSALKTYTNNEIGISFLIPDTWIKNGKETSAINRNGDEMTKRVNFIDTITHSAFLVEYHLAPYGAELYKYAIAQFDSTHSLNGTNSKQIKIAGSDALESVTIMSEDIKGNIYDPPLKMVHIVFLDKQLTGEFELSFQTTVLNETRDVAKLQQLLSSIKFIDLINSEKNIETPTIYGVDISHWNGTVSWTTVYAAGKSFSFVKSTEGVNTNDANFNTNMTSSNPNGVVLGAYHLGRPDYSSNNTATNEANHFWTIASDFTGNGFLPPALDMEPANIDAYITQGNSYNQLAQWINTWCSQIHNSSGKWPILYTTKCYAANLYPQYQNGTINSNIQLWIATNNISTDPAGSPGTTTCGSWSSWSWFFHQYFAPGSAGSNPTTYANPGMDQNAFYGTLTEFNNLIGGSSTPLPSIVSANLNTTSITLGQTVSLSVSAINNGAASSYGSISVSFPDFTNSSDNSNISTTSSSFGSSYAIITAGNQVSNNNCQSLPANYMLAEYYDVNWVNNETNNVTLNIQPQTTGSFDIYIRTNMRNGSSGCVYINDPATSSYTDQQGWAVQKFTVIVISASANDNCPGTTLIVNGNQITGDVAGATQSIAAITCNNWTGSSEDDIWYNFIAPSGGNARITVIGSSGFDAVVDLRSGGCNGSNINCADLTIGGGTEIIDASGLIFGNTYYVRIYDYETTVPSTTSFTIKVETLVNVSEIKSNNSITIFPNPTTGELSIENSSGTPIQKIEIYNLLGQKVWEENTEGKISNKETYKINIQQLAAGSYNMQITTGKGVVSKQVAVEENGK